MAKVDPIERFDPSEREGDVGRKRGKGKGGVRFSIIAESVHARVRKPRGRQDARDRFKERYFYSRLRLLKKNYCADNMLGR